MVKSQQHRIELVTRLDISNRGKGEVACLSVGLRQRNSSASDHQVQELSLEAFRRQCQVRKIDGSIAGMVTDLIFLLNFYYLEIL